MQPIHYKRCAVLIPAFIQYYQQHFTLFSPTDASAVTANIHMMAAFVHETGQEWAS